MIIRTEESRKLGAKYLDFAEMGSREECLRLCCETDECDVFVYEEKVCDSKRAPMPSAKYVVIKCIFRYICLEYWIMLSVPLWARAKLSLQICGTLKLHKCCSNTSRKKSATTATITGWYVSSASTHPSQSVTTRNRIIQFEREIKSIVSNFNLFIC